jgi:PKD repeat protein
MTLPFCFRTHALAAVFSIACLGLVLAGCDSGGTNEQTNEPPSASLSLDSRDGRTAAFSGAGSTDPDGEVASYEWSFGDGETDTGETVLHTYGADGTYTATLTVTDDQGSTDTTQMDVMVSRTPTTFDVTIENVGSARPLTKAGVFNTPVSADQPGPLMPGEAYEVSFTVGPNELPGSGMKFSLASMFVQSNDIFYAFDAGGIDLFDDTDAPRFQDGPVDVTDQLSYWDAGTEVDQEPGTGDNQAPRQSGPDTGPDENGNLVKVTDSDNDGMPDDSGFEYPAVADGIEVTLNSEPDDATGAIRFTVRVENVSDETGTTVNGAPIVISPGAFAAHFDQVPGAGNEVAFFVPDAPESESIEGIEEIAEDGKPGVRAEAAAPLTGPTVPLSPGAFASHTDDVQAFAVGESASAGIEGVAEDGMPGPLASELDASNDAIRTSGVFNTPDGASSPGPLPPGNSYSFQVEAQPGELLSFATMYIQSNDFFYGVQPNGMPLFSNDAPINGTMTEQVMLYDAGTEGDEEPGTGLNQAPRQPGTDTGPSGEGSIVRVTNADDDRFLDNDSFKYEETKNIVKVTITPQN